MIVRVPRSSEGFDMMRRSRWIPALFLLAWAARLAPAQAPAEQLVSASDTPCGQSAEVLAPAIQVCDSGGEGARSCETRWVVSMGGWGWPSGCGISCADGYYACCTNPAWNRNATCNCLADPPHVAPAPYSPETPGL